ncbi:colicin uptake protein TolR [Phocoenobacter skyensis]|uniref:Tol-Pal system protein TolR n=1 Tax=Phocoenobacter skyensis TaxID=97481 RepID=A0A1H7WYA2_9PAST|nr:colicin uptake protein TolR [Pasteurella skyensis]MDP8079302.1 colicin uptake protein TolR [Pasteurella skyensis]MDP8085477.1 colicin uptake protein TolR [Pasteurella skyensis]MDP8161624.1 colicin uptake protein TolR [Pasteurella skyensis]MDP8170511.1 colicin uptake protein TolR [Pasteurella skyensis]MDP8171780.1 colicin uptake protein TolR [Pasteurella skyensis]
MSYRRRSRNNIKSEINIVPFLDVLLVLLLIFMATAPVISQSVEVDLPQDKHSQSVSNVDKKPVILQVEGIGLYKLKVDGHFVEVEGETALTEQSVVVYASQSFEKDPKTLFLVAGQRNVPYEEIIKGISLLKDAGIKTVGLMTSSK